MISAFPFDPINTTALTTNTNAPAVLAATHLTTECIANSIKSANLDQQQTHLHHQTAEIPKYMHESEQHVDYVHSLVGKSNQPIVGVGKIKNSSTSNFFCPFLSSSFLHNVDMTVHAIDSIWPPATPSPPQSANAPSDTKKVVDTRTFIKHILRNSRTRHSTLLIAIFYLFRIKPRLSLALQALPTEERRYLLCGRRMFLVSLTLAWKYQEDRSPGSKFWAKVSGLPVTQITQAERLFLGLLDYKLHIPKDSYDQWTTLVQQHCGKNTLPTTDITPTPVRTPLSCADNQPTLSEHTTKKRRGAISAPVYQCQGRPVEHTAVHQLPTPPAEALDCSFASGDLKRKWQST
jgi:hypothetical protein